MKRAEQTDKIMSIFFSAVTFLVFAFVMSFIVYIFWAGRNNLNLKFIFGTDSTGIDGPIGIGTQIFNTVYIVLLSMVITIPVGLGAGIYMAEYAKEGRFKKIIRMCIETLSSIPSIVIGLFGFLVFVQILKLQYSIISGAFALSILNIPMMTRLSEDAVRAVDPSIKEGSLALGATRFQTIAKAIVPASITGIITGALLSTGRAFGEAAALIYTAGVTTNNLNLSHLSPFDPVSSLYLVRPAETLSVFIWKVNSEGLVANSADIANSAAAVLLIIVLIINISARILQKSLSKKFKGE